MAKLNWEKAKHRRPSARQLREDEERKIELAKQQELLDEQIALRKPGWLSRVMEEASRRHTLQGLVNQLRSDEVPKVIALVEELRRNRK